MITKKLLLVATLAASVLLPATVPAQTFSIEIGDRPYYRHGARYWAGDWEMIWVPGHWSRHRRQWVHGHYVRGEHRRHHRWDRRDDRRDRWEDRRDDGRDYRRDDRY
jgi:hypothetical protein